MTNLTETQKVIALAELERNACAMRTKEGIRTKVESGQYPYHPPYGYKSVETKGNKYKKMVIDKENAFFVRQAFDMCLQGDSIDTITSKLYEMGFRNERGGKIGKTSIEHILRNIVYIGKFYYDGILIENTDYPPLINESTFYLVQDKLNGTKRTKQRIERTNKKGELKMANLTETQKVVTYLRVTSKTQANAGYSLELQREELRKYAEENNLEIIKEFSDIAGANKTDREGFNKMLEYLETSKDCKTILVTKIDRLCRNTETYGELESYSVISIAEGTDKNIHQCSIMMAENHSKRMFELIKANMQERKEEKEKKVELTLMLPEKEIIELQDYANKGNVSIDDFIDNCNKTDLSCVIDTFDSDRERFVVQDGSDYQIDRRGFISCDDYREGNVPLTVNITESSTFLLELNAKKYRLTTSAFLDELISRSTLHIDEDYGKFCALVDELKETAKYLNDYGYDTEFMLHNLMAN